MRIFRNARDRKALEENERVAFEAKTKVQQHERMEPEPPRSGAAQEEQTTSEVETQASTKKARKKKVDSGV